MQEEDWGQDLHLDSPSGFLFQRPKPFDYDDKDLMLACERHLDSSAYQTYLEDDDTNSSIYSFGSFISSRLDIDDYMLNLARPVDDTSGLEFPPDLSSLTQRLEKKVRPSRLPVRVQKVRQESPEDDLLEGLELDSIRLDRKPTLEKTSGHGYALLSRPKTKPSESYCARLDTIDTTSKRRLPPKVLTKSKVSNVDPDRPWRNNMQPSKSTVRKPKVKPTLIQPNERTIEKEYNGMRYDEKTQQWKGNESILKTFQETTKPRTSRLMLMSPKQHTPSRYAAVMGGNSMVFDPALQKWVSAFGQECDELDAIEDLDDRLAPHGVKAKEKEFRLTPEMKRHMMSQQQEHEEWIRYWPLAAEETQHVTTDSGHTVEASKYFLKIRLF